MYKFTKEFMDEFMTLSKRLKEPGGPVRREDIERASAMVGLMKEHLWDRKWQGRVLLAMCIRRGESAIKAAEERAGIKVDPSHPPAASSVTADVENAFSTLGLVMTADVKAIRAAYRVLVQVWHPDRFNHDPKLQTKCQESMKNINRAYEIALRWASDGRV